MGCPWEAAVNTLLVCSLALQGSASNLRGTCGNWHCWWRDYCQHLSAGALCSPVPLERVLVSCGIVCTAESTLAVKAMSDVSTGVPMWLMSSALNLGVPNTQLELERLASGWVPSRCLVRTCQGAEKGHDLQAEVEKGNSAQAEGREIKAPVPSLCLIGQKVELLTELMKGKLGDYWPLDTSWGVRGNREHQSCSHLLPGKSIW